MTPANPFSRRSRARFADVAFQSLAGTVFDAIGALLVMHGLHGMHVQTGYWPCFWVVAGISSSVVLCASVYIGGPSR